MKYIIKKLISLFIFLSLIQLTITEEVANQEENKNVIITATSGFINKELDSDNNLSFLIKCLVNSVIDGFNLTIPITCDSVEGYAECKIKSVKKLENENGQTELNCTIKQSNFTSITLSNESHINITSIKYDKYIFKKFDQLPSSVSASVSKIEYNSTDGCKNNNLVFKINVEMNANPPLAMRFNLALTSPESHKEANCILPTIGNTITCKIDVGEKKINQGEKISFDQQQIVLENGQSLTINKLIYPLNIEQDCGEQINSSGNFIKNNFILIKTLLLLIIISI